MIDVNWDLAPEGAEELVQFESHVTWRKGIKIWCMVQEDWRDYVSDFKTIATRPTQTKTVADAVEWHKSKGWGLSWASKAKDCITHGNLGFAFADSRNIQLDRKLVCTREQFEAYVKEQEAEKWTHTWNRDKCRVIFTEGDSSWIKGHFISTIVLTERLKPIKPTISKAEAWDLCQDYEGSQGMVKYMLDLHDQYDIVEVPAND